MQLSKDAFESALAQDMQQLAVSNVSNPVNDKKSMFGPQTDLQGLPLQQQNQPAPTGKTKREILWEQRMAAKKNAANPPAIGGQGNNLIDQMNPAARAHLIRTPEQNTQGKGN